LLGYLFCFCYPKFEKKSRKLANVCMYVVPVGLTIVPSSKQDVPTDSTLYEHCLHCTLLHRMYTQNHLIWSQGILINLVKLVKISKNTNEKIDAEDQTRN